MDATNVRIYRQFVYGDADNPRPIPESLEKIHNEIFLLQRSYCGRSQISVDAHTMVWLTWKYQTEEGRDFYGLPKILAAASVPITEPWVIEPNDPLPDVPVNYDGQSVEFRPNSDNTPQKHVDWKEVAVGTPVITNIMNKGIKVGTFVRNDNQGRLVIKDLEGNLIKASAIRTSVADVVPV